MYQRAWFGRVLRNEAVAAIRRIRYRGKWPFRTFAIEIPIAPEVPGKPERFTAIVLLPSVET